jgi:uncharacterized RDD family membrane protein YckC
MEFTSTLPSDEVANDDEIVREGGRLVAEALQEMLRALGCEAEPPSEANHGWAFDFSYGGRPIHGHLGYIEHYHAIFDDRWGSKAAHHPSFVELMTRFAEALAADPRFGAIQWFVCDDLLSGRRGARRPSDGLSSSAIIPDLQGQWSDLSPRPVRRWAARFFDSYMLAAICVWGPTFIFFGPLHPDDEFAVIPAVAFLFLPLWHVASSLLNVIPLRCASTTPGKWIFGVRIVRRDGRPMTCGAALKREVEAVTTGCALGFVPFDIMALWSNYSQLSEEGETSWDARRGLVAIYRQNNLWQGLLALAAAAGVAVLWCYSCSLLF